MARTWFLRDWFLGACLATVLVPSTFGQNVVVVPNANATVAGGDTSNLPAMPVSYEFQSVYGSGQFGSVTQPLYITGFSFRAAPGGGPASLTLAGKVYVSTSPNYPNTNGGGKTLLSTTFADNVGADNTLVFSGSGTMNGAGCAGPAPCPFANNIVFTTPLLYNPANGPLLIDVQATSISGTGNFDKIDCSAPGCSVAAVNGPLGTPIGSFKYGGNITQFTYTAVPAFFTGETTLGSGVYYLQFPNGNLFGYYNFPSYPFLYHYDLGFEYFFDGGNGAAYLYDFASGHWWYTSSSLFPYLYDFTLSDWLYYLPATKNPGHYTSSPRYFSDLTTGKIITM